MLTVCMLGFAMSACSAEEEPKTTQNQTEIKQKEQTNTENNQDQKMLIAYFTYGENAGLSSNVDVSTSASIQLLNGQVTGNAGILAQMIQESTGGIVFSIKTSEPYPDNYDATIDRGQKENEEGARPQLATYIENLDSYDTVFIGFPNWWYDMPMIMYSFFEEYDFSGKTIVPFSTSGGSGFSDTIETIKGLEPNATVLEGLTIGASSVNHAQNDVNDWLRTLGYLQ